MFNFHGKTQFYNFVSDFICPSAIAAPENHWHEYCYTIESIGSNIWDLALLPGRCKVKIFAEISDVTVKLNLIYTNISSMWTDGTSVK